LNRRGRGQRGFTLVELMVALAAGLIVSLGIIGLSRDATHTFHEEMRSSAAEANLRTAIDRLRADLSRAGYMSTGNIFSDPQISKPPGAGNPINAAAGLAGLSKLTSILLNQGGSAGQTLLSTQQLPPMNPDSIDIAGNMTSTDQYEVQSVVPGAGGGACWQIILQAQSPSMLRLLALGAAAPQEFINIFQPGAGQFIVRFVEHTGRTQFFATCPNQPPLLLGAGPNAQASIFISPLTLQQTAQTSQGVGSATGLSTGTQVNPVQIVRWQLIAAKNEEPQYTGSPLGNQALTGTAIDANKYDLVRRYIDAATGQPVPGTMEVVAEYAVDLEFAFTVEAGSQVQPNLQTFPFDSLSGAANNPPWAQDINAFPPLPGQNRGAQRIRSVRVRLVTRAADPDRTANVPVVNPNNAPIGPYTYRYCTAPPCPQANTTNGVLQYARARTVTAEVALPNQARNFY
jgi:prepilin-type N-terminal cleavage/methylation domain-containing protein